MFYRWQYRAFFQAETLALGGLSGIAPPGHSQPAQTGSRPAAQADGRPDRARRTGSGPAWDCGPDRGYSGADLGAVYDQAKHALLERELAARADSVVATQDFKKDALAPVRHRRHDEGLRGMARATNRAQ